MNGQPGSAPIYLDHAATTPVAPEVIAAMNDCLADVRRCANPSSIHVAGRAAAAACEDARSALAVLLNVAPRDLVWTSGATESDNLAIVGAARARRHRGRHLVTLTTEHKAVVDTFRALTKDGFDVTWLTPGADGRLDLAELEQALRHDTQLVSVMHVNNETGAVQDIEAIGRLCRDRDVLYHCDAAQSVGKLPLDLAALPVDLVSLTAHKFHGPPGIGALYIAPRSGVVVEPLLHGGGQQQRRRPGTLPGHLIVGCGVAAGLATASQGDDLAHVESLRDTLWAGIRGLPGLTLNSPPTGGYPGILNVSATGVEGESLLLALEPLCVATGAACNSLSGEPSYVLRALGRSDEEAQSAIRFSFGRDTTRADIEFAAAVYTSAVERLRALAPG
ncbi:MAG: aminotransferase class V-fold PLP-dependent enzyme [Woeseiaceae bacterium]|nr:aminotransferase class V-fold PLP-dependent enzyme [Woeseiaceae bacterium]